MTSKQTYMALAVAAALTLSACGKKDAEPVAAAEPAAATAEPTQHFKQAERFGTVSNIALTSLFAVPPKYAACIRQEVTEANKAEYRKLPEAAFQQYVTNWMRHATSSEKPDWVTLAGIGHPEVSQASNEFTKQAAAERLKASIAADQKNDRALFSVLGSDVAISGPDVTNGEYYIVIQKRSSSWVVNYVTDKKYRYALSYRTVFDTLGLTGDNHGYMQFTVRVPLEKAKEIESMREGQTPIMRVYGRIKGFNSDRSPLLDRDGVEAGLDVDVEALEFGVKKDGKFETLFFLDTDQLRKSKA